MKKLFSILLIATFLVATAVKADAQSAYKYNYRVAVPLTSAIAIALTPVTTEVVYTLVADTNVTFTATTTGAVIGDELVLKIQGHTRTRTITWSTNLNAMASDTIHHGNATIYNFIYTGTKYDLYSWYRLTTY